MRNLKLAIESTLQIYAYALVGTTGNEQNNIIILDIGTPAQLYRYLTIIFGAERVTKYKGKVMVKRDEERYK